jgi:glycerol kinase
MAVVLAIDAGTTGVRALAVDENGEPAGWSYREFPQHFPRPGWVEHDASEIWSAVQTTVAELAAALTARRQVIAAIGITDQRETTARRWPGPLSGRTDARPPAARRSARPATSTSSGT